MPYVGTSPRGDLLSSHSGTVRWSESCCLYVTSHCCLQGHRPSVSPHPQGTALWSRRTDTRTHFPGLPPLRWAIPRSLRPSVLFPHPGSSWGEGCLSPAPSHMTIPPLQEWPGAANDRSLTPNRGGWPWSMREQTAGSQRVPCPGAHAHHLPHPYRCHQRAPMHPPQGPDPAREQT